MSQSYLEAFLNIIPATQQKRLLEILQADSASNGVVPDAATLQDQLAALIAELSVPLGSPLINYRKAEKYSKISSDDYNKTMKELYADLGALFKQDNDINKTILIHKSLDLSVLTDVRAALRKITNDVKVFQILKTNRSGITDAVYNNFYKDDNQITNPVFKASIDTDTNSIKLPVGVDLSSLSINGLASAEISLNRFGGGIRGTIDNTQNTVSAQKAIDGSSDTFWVEVILADQPIKQTYNGASVFGTVCEIVLKMYRPEIINYIRYNPFTRYPLTILDIKYKSKNSSDWVSLGVASQTSTSIMEFNFDEVQAQQVMIVVNQENASANTYQIPKRLINNAQLWQQIVDRELSITNQSGGLLSATQDMIDYVDGWQAYNDATIRYGNIIKKIGKPADYLFKQSFSESIFDATTQQILSTSINGADSLKLNLYGKQAAANDTLVEVRKYEYIYGAYSIDVKKRWYIDTGEYLSPKYQPNGVVIEAEFDVIDATPSGTTIEYQLSSRDGVWDNILPDGGATYITKERLDIDPITESGILRFPCSGVLSAVYLNDNLIAPSGYVFTSNTSNVALASGFYIGTAAYTVSYSPFSLNKTISFQNDSLTPSEEIYTQVASSQFMVGLNHFPYIDYRIINDTTLGNNSNPDFSYTIGRWLNINPSGNQIYGIVAGAYYDPLIVTVDGYSAENRTDYYDNTRPALTKYDSTFYPNFEYFQSEKNLYFNVPLANRTVKVVYSYLNDFIQFKALLRNNMRSTVTKTPSLKEYTINLRTI